MARSLPVSATGSRVTYRFEDFLCDPSAYELRRNGRRLPLARQPMDLLLLLLERRGDLVTREEIGKRLWRDGVFVDLDAGIRTAVLKVRQALDDSRSPRFVETVPGKGYRFVAPVEISATLAAAGAEGRHNLPADLTSFVGRAAALDDLRRLLGDTRLLSLTGPGGVGKSRLALRLAFNVVPRFPGGVWFVDLAPLTASGLVAQTVAALLGVRESPQRSLHDALVEHLRGRELLLVFDTCEHLIDECAALVEALLRAAPALRIVTTTREALRLPGETIYKVAPLSIPGISPTCSLKHLVEFESTDLFVQRATAADPSLIVDEASAGTIATICQQLDGLPLAIELAAAQAAAVSLPDIERQLASGPAATGTRTAVVRQRTLDATVAWSHRLLSTPEQLLFSRLAVFPAAWTAEAAAQICQGEGFEANDIAEVMQRLVAKSLVNVAGEALDRRRYHLLETIRHYARERLTESGAGERLRDRHFAYFHAEFREVGRVLTGPEQAACLRLLQDEQPNLRAALDWGLSTPALAVNAAELAAALFWYWTKRGLFAEGRYWLERAAAVQAPALLRGHVALGLGHMDYFQGRAAAMAVRNDEVLAWGREAGDGWLVSRGFFGHALAKFECGAFDEAAASAYAAREAVPGEDFSPALLVLGNVALVSGDHDRALQYFEDGVNGLRRSGEIWGLGILLSLAAGLHTVRGDFVAARAHAEEALTIYRALEDPRGLAWSLDVFAGLLAAEGRVGDAAAIWGASDALLESVGGTLVPTVGWIRDRYFAPAREALGASLFESTRTTGREWPLERTVAVATTRIAARRVQGRRR